MRRFAILLTTVALALAACASSATPSPAPTGPASSSPPSASALPSPSSLPSPTAVPRAVGGGCGATQVYAGPGPDAAIGLADNSWAVAEPASAGIVAYFRYPSPDLLFTNADGSNRTKVLWVSHGEQARTLTVTAHPLGATRPVVTIETPAATAPAGNYASSIELPTPGCWHLDIALGASRASLDVTVAGAPVPSSGASASP